MKLSVKSTAVLSMEESVMRDLGPTSFTICMSIKIKTKEKFLIILTFGIKKSQMENAMSDLSNNGD